MTVSLADQIIEVEKTVRDRARTYPDLVGRGRFRQETADHKLSAMRAVQATLTWLEANAAWIKAEAEARRGMTPERRAAVSLIKQAYPGAELVAPAEPALHEFLPEPEFTEEAV